MLPAPLQRMKVGFGPARRLWPARRDDRRGWFCDRPCRRLRIEGRRARVVAPARAAPCKSLRFRSRPGRLRAPPRVRRPREPPLSRGNARRTENHGGMQPCRHVHSALQSEGCPSAVAIRSGWTRFGSRGCNSHAVICFEGLLSALSQMIPRWFRLETGPHFAARRRGGTLLPPFVAWRRVRTTRNLQI